MKLKYIIILAGLAVAFSAASLWVFLSGGNNAKAVRAKFRLGGLMLTVSSMLAFASCEGGGNGIFSPDCYDPVPPEMVEYISFGQGEFHVGDVIEFMMLKQCPEGCDSIRCEIRGTSAELIQREDFKYTQDAIKLTIAETDYRGSAYLETGFLMDDDIIFGLDSRGITLK